ncbi:family 43 glycosylhydrolase [Actinoplanes sp. NPDC049599]|uniref:family 43 glycosylhydrolase n=1 Tax=Actinoplanes sp. NPDC049599 TaxID=3363903 RepID=UPI003788CB26
MVAESRLFPRIAVPLLLAAGMLLAPSAAAAADVTDGLVLRYDLDQTSGGTAVDTSGHGRDGVLRGDASWAAGGAGLVLGGADGHVDLPDNVLAGLDEVTVSADVAIDPAQASPYMIWALGNTDAGGAGNGYLFATGDVYRTSIASGNWSTEQTARATAALPRSVWVSIGYTLGADGVATEYLNGEPVATKTGVTVKPGGIGAGATTANYLGRSVYSADAYLRGRVRNFRIYDRALSATEAAGIAIPAATRVAGDKAALTLGDTSAVTADLSLPAAGPAYGSKLTWATSDPDVITAAGAVTRPAADTTVTLTATVSSGSVSDTRAFAVTVKAALSAAERVEEARAALTVTNLDDVRGNLTLPVTGRHGTTVAWSSADAATISPTGVVRRPAAGSPARRVDLTATVSLGAVSAEKTLTATVPPLPAPAPLKGYAFAYFTGNSIAGEKIHFAASQGNNALRWTELNGGQPVLSSTLGTKGLRDPFLIRSPEGDKFFLIATDLSIGSGTSWDDSQRRGSRHIEVWESTDLVHWGQQRHVLVSPPTAGNTWAPEAFWDDALGQYVVFWASKLYAESDPGHTGDTYNRMLYATTRDFVSFSAPRIWQDRGASRIDSTVIKEGGRYHRFTKDEGGVTGCSDIIQERADSLVAVDDVADPAHDPAHPAWPIVASCIGKAAGTSAVEGPTAFKANPGDESGSDYYLFVDEYGGRGYIPLGTDDLDNPQWRVPASYALPQSPRHGTVLPVTQAELDRLSGAPEPLPAGADGLVARYALDQTSGTTVVDSSGNGNNATVVGGATWRDGSLAFGGTDGHVKLPDNTMAGMRGLTVSADVWVDPAQQKPYFLWGMGNTDAAGVGNGYVFSTGDNYRAAIASGNWSTEQGAATSSPLGRGAWRTLTYTTGDGRATLYLDGRQVAQNTAVTVTPGAIGNGVTKANYLGRSVYTADKYFQGRMRDVRIYNRALSGAEVAELGANATTVSAVTLDSLRAPALIDSEAGTIVLPVRPGTDRRNLNPVFTVAGTSTVTGAGAGDWSTARRITVTSAAGATRAYTVTTRVMRSPVLPGTTADPNIVRFGDTYYIYATTDGIAGWGSTTFKVWSSTDLATWTEHGTILDLADVSWAHTNAWAPAITAANGKYYFYFCAAGNIGVATADSPLGPFTDSGAPLIDRDDYRNAQQIDPAVFTDDDGQSYLYWGNGTAYVAPLNPDLTSIDVAKRQTIGGLTSFREGLFMNKRNGTYYLSYSIDDTGSENYRVGYATATAPYGPFTAKGLILAKDPALGILGTGHSSIIQVPGGDEWYIAYHRFAIPGGDGFHRETTLDRLYFDAAGAITPVIPTLESVDPLAYTGIPPRAAVSRPGSDGWSGAGATLTLDGGTGNSAVEYALADGAWTGYTGPVPLPAGEYTVRHRARGANLILGPVAELAVRVDPEPPMSAVAVRAGRDAWTVTLSAQDTASGVASIGYRVDDGPWQPYAKPFTLTGTHRLAFFATDRAGNAETVQQVGVPLQPDRTAPAVTGATDPARATGEHGWFTGPVALVVTATDPSGIASREYRIGGGRWQAYTKPVPLPVGVTVVSYRATDRAGNVSAPGTLTVRRDVRAPSVAASFRPGNGSTRVTLTAKDDVSGVQVISYRVDGGAWTTYRGPVKVRGKGNHRVSYRATDKAGNRSAPWTFQIRVR